MAAAPILPETRTVIFLSKATSGDDEFAMWLAPRLEAEGYTVFADILALQPGDRWRREITETLQSRAARMLLCCRDSTLAKEGVQEEIGIALDLCKSLGDKNFLIPLRLEPYKKLFGIGELQYIDFVRGWGQGLSKLLEALKRQKVPRGSVATEINPNWEVYRRRNAVPLLRQPERLTSSWLRVSECPDALNYYEPVGSINRSRLPAACEKAGFPVVAANMGVLTFADPADVNDALSSVGRFTLKAQRSPPVLVAEGWPQLGIARQDASNLVHSMFRQAWIGYCRRRGLVEFTYASVSSGFHADARQVKIGQRIYWGGQGERRWSMLRNVARGHVWSYGVTALPSFWPFPHFKLKSRVLFAPLVGTEAGVTIEDARKQHRLRRGVCKGWRNKQWYGRMLAFLELLSEQTAFIRLPLAPGANIVLDATPLLFTSPVSTMLPNEQGDEQDEQDESTLGKPEPEDDEP